MTVRWGRPSRFALVGALAIVVACGDAEPKGATLEPANAASAASSGEAPGATASLASASAAASASTSASGVDAVSAASQYAGGTPVLGAGSIDGEALRKRHEARLAAEPPTVVALKGDDAAALGEAICEAVVPKRAPETPVLIKPNMGGLDALKDPAKSGGDDGVKGRTTDPEFVRGVIRCLKKRGHTKILVADGWGAPKEWWPKLLATSGYGAMAESEGVKIACLCDDGVFDVEGDQPGKPVKVTGMDKTRLPTLLLPKAVAEHLDHGLFIDVAKMKTHRYAVVSLGIKNLQGIVMLSSGTPAHKQKWRMHEELNAYLKDKADGHEDRAAYVKSLESFSERITDVLLVATPDVVLLEGAPAMQGDGFQDLRPVADRIAIGGTNPVRVDQVGARFLGAWKNPKIAAGLMGIDSSPLILRAGKRLGVDFEATKLEGDGAALVDAPRPFDFKAIAPFEVHTKPK
jgi:uncharacterized protein (DUF362 family)